VGRGDGSEPNFGTNSISTGTKFVTVTKEKISCIKNDETPFPNYPESAKI